MKYSQPFIILTALSLLVCFNYISAWTVPGANPPSGNVEAPINTGAITQTKIGGLGVTSLLSTDASVNNWIAIGAASPSTGLDGTTLELDVDGDAGAMKYCDNSGDNCVAASSLKKFQFGGMYSRDVTNATCSQGNYYLPPLYPCSCPSGFTDRLVASGLTGGASDKIFYCAPTT